jgi:hypothetical protein
MVKIKIKARIKGTNSFMGTTNAAARQSTALILLCWIVYACSYIGKVNYARISMKL